MKLPRDLSGAQLAKALARVGYSTTRQTGSHLRLTTASPSEHHITIPVHDFLRIGKLAAILADVAAHQKIRNVETINRPNGRLSIRESEFLPWGKPARSLTQLVLRATEE